MRLSVNKTDSGYHPLASSCSVELNGKIIRGCHTIDEEKKYVLKYKEDSKVVGRFKIIFPDNWVFSVKYHKKKRLRKKLNRR